MWHLLFAGIRDYLIEIMLIGCFAWENAQIDEELERYLTKYIQMNEKNRFKHEINSICICKIKMEVFLFCF